MRVMILTQEPERRTRMAASLAQRGYDVTVAPHRQDVLKLVKDTSPAVIVLDLYLTDPSGVATLGQLRDQGYEGKVVVLAGPSMRSALVETFRLGADQVVGGIQATGGSFDPLEIESAIRGCFRDTIARRAARLWEESGQPAGRDLEFWVAAEREVLGRRGA